MQPEDQGIMAAPVDFDSLEVLEPLSPNAMSGAPVPSAFGSGRMDLSSATSGSLGIPEGPSRGQREPLAAAASSAERTTRRLDDIQSRAQSLPVEIAEGERGGSGAGDTHEKAREKNRRNQRTFRQRQKVAQLALQSRTFQAVLQHSLACLVLLERRELAICRPKPSSRMKS